MNHYRTQIIMHKAYLSTKKATWDCLLFNAAQEVSRYPRFAKPGEPLFLPPHVRNWYEASWEDRWYGARLTIRYCWIPDGH